MRKGVPKQDVLRIALTGYAGVGKDVAGEILAAKLRLKRVALGDLIKEELDGLITKHLGFSAFTVVPEQKKRIREVLVHWGYANYDKLIQRFMRAVPKRAVNTRLFRLQEAREWVAIGGVIVEVRRTGFGPAEPKEAEELDLICQAGLIRCVLHNEGTLDEFRSVVASLGTETANGR